VQVVAIVIDANNDGLGDVLDRVPVRDRLFGVHYGQCAISIDPDEESGKRLAVLTAAQVGIHLPTSR
jgi:hypothetical protein